MKLANRKNMMSISGMISIRACFFGIGEATFMACPLVRRSRHGERDRDLYLRHAAGLKFPALERGQGRLIQKIIPNTHRHGGVGDAASCRINRDYADAGTGDL